MVEQATLFFPAPRLGFRRFSALGGKQQEAALRAWGSSRLAPRRLVFQTYFAQIAAMAGAGIAIGLVIGGLAPVAGGAVMVIAVWIWEMAVRLRVAALVDDHVPDR